MVSCKKGANDKEPKVVSCFKEMANTNWLILFFVYSGPHPMLGRLSVYCVSEMIFYEALFAQESLVLTSKSLYLLSTECLAWIRHCSNSYPIHFSLKSLR